MAEAVATESGSLPNPGYRERYSWHAKPWAALTQDMSRLPHAVLLHGPSGLGKTAFAWRLAHSLLCTRREPDAAGCGQCHSCALFDAGTHPDLLLVSPLGDSSIITVDQVRAVHEFLALRPHTAPHKLVLLMPAEAMNVNAANALLKVLEEPPPGGLLVLVTPQPTRLPATIRSRCSAIAFRPPTVAEASQWLTNNGLSGDLPVLLQQAGGAPLSVLAAIQSPEETTDDELQKDLQQLQAGQEDPVRCATRWKGIGAPRCLAWFQRHIATAIRVAMASENKEKYNINIKDLFIFSDVISRARTALNGPVDEALLLEDVLIEWRRISRGMG